MLNGTIEVNYSETEARIETTVLSGRNRTLPISISINKQTAIMRTRKKGLCVVFLSSEHVIINEQYEKIKSIINQLN
jgi:hypothetical protein